MEDSKITELNASELLEALADLRKTNQEQAEYAKKAWIMSLIATIAVLIVAVFIIAYGMFLVPKVNTLLDEAQVSLKNIEVITDELQKVDYEGLIDDVGGLVATTEDDLRRTMVKIDSLDIDELNRAIKNLSNVIEPLADFFGVLGDEADNLSQIDVGKNIEDRVDGISGNIEERIDGIGESIEDSIGDIGSSIGTGIEKGIEKGIEDQIGNVFGANKKVKQKKN